MAMARTARLIVSIAGVLAGVGLSAALAHRAAVLGGVIVELRGRIDSLERLRETPPIHDVEGADVADHRLYEWPGKDGGVEDGGVNGADGVAERRPPQVVVVGGRVCAYCEASWAGWLGSLREGDVAWYVSVDGEEVLPDGLLMKRWSGGDVRLAQVRDGETFLARTGVRVIPTTFIFQGGGGRLRCVVSGIPQPRQIHACSAGAVGIRGTLFFRNPTSRQVVDTATLPWQGLP